MIDTIYIGNVEDENSLEHYGVGHDKGGHSGRYPWGSGDSPYQDDPSYKTRYDSPKGFLDDYNKMKKEGLTKNELVKAFDLNSTSELEAAVGVAATRVRNQQRDTAVKLRDDGKSLREIAKEMGFTNDSSVRELLKESTNMNKNRQFELADKLKDMVDELGMVDVGKGTEHLLGTTYESLQRSLYILQAEYGYKIVGRRIEQMTNPGQFTTIKVAVPPDAPENILYTQDIENRVRIVEDFGNAKEKYQDINLKPSFSKPESIDRNRVGIRYRDEGGLEKDGLIEIRPGVEDLSLGKALYSQVRIAVKDRDGKPAYYLKGMAVYNNNLPDGVDVLVNTNKGTDKSDSEVFKELKKTKSGDIDWENPFGSAIKETGGQYWYYDKNGKERLGLINKRADEGDWEDWTKSLPSQFLAKQNPKLIKQQLDYTIADKNDEFQEILKIDNPTLKRKILLDFADGLESQAEHLKAAALPRQRYQVILPINTLKDNEVFAPNFQNGEKIALVRFPHAGPFEIPILTVNNKNKEGIAMIGNTPQDAVGINSNNAGKLSGADFDGDTVIAIPLSDQVTISSRPSLKGLEGFEGKDKYPPKYKYDDDGNKVLDSDGKPIIVSKVMSKKNLQKHMGEASNLITDMTLMGADDDEIARAVRHSMVVVDAPKHKLDYIQSEIDNDIAGLKKKYQIHDWKDWQGKLHEGSTGAATLLSRSKAQYSAPVHEGYQKIDPETGKKVWTREGYKTVIDFSKTPYTWDERVDIKTGEVVPYKKYDYSQAVKKTKTYKSTWMAETDDAMDLVRDPNNKVEVMYADFANSLKALSNEARKEYSSTSIKRYDPDMAVKYAKDVDSLNNKLRLANSNAPRERQAQIMANILFDEFKASLNDDLDRAEEKKIRDKLLKKARLACNAKRYEIDLTDSEWEAIQAGAISNSKAAEIFLKCDQDKLRDRATPKERFQMTPIKEAKVIAMMNSGYTTEEIARSIGASTSIVSDYLRERR